MTLITGALIVISLIGSFLLGQVVGMAYVTNKRVLPLKKNLREAMKMLSDTSKMLGHLQAELIKKEDDDNDKGILSPIQFKKM